MLNLSMLESRIGTNSGTRSCCARVTHRSFAQEQRTPRISGRFGSELRDRLRALLRDRHFTEGETSRVRANLVCEKTLHDLALTLDLSSFSSWAKANCDAPSVLADAMEAIFGAVFFEAGFEEAQKVVLRVYEPILSSLTPETFSKDPKTRLREMLQGSHLPRPAYAIVNTTGRRTSAPSRASAASNPAGVLTYGKASSRRGRTGSRRAHD